MATVAITGYGGVLANGGSAGAGYTTTAQLKKFDFSGIKVEFDRNQDHGNLRLENPLDVFALRAFQPGRSEAGDAEAR